MWFCNLCQVSCTSDYGKEEHLNGRKHREKELETPRTNRTTSSAGGNVCFNFQRGNCVYGSNCKYSHVIASREKAPARITPAASTSSNNKSNNTANNVVCGEFILCKGNVHDDDNTSVNASVVVKQEDPQSKKVFSLFEKKPSPSSKFTIRSANSTESPVVANKFPEIYRNAFKGKKNVSLSIRNEQVVWQFAYNTTIMSAIKNHIQGRAWNPNMKCWTSPLESLPDAVALYEFMGRSADQDLRQRAKDITKSLGDDATLSIRLAVEVDISPSSSDSNLPMPSLGRVRLSFLYNPEIIAAIKCISPAQRMYDPISKEWTVDLLELPELLVEHLKPLGYHPSRALEQISNSCQSLHQGLYPQQQAGDDNDQKENESMQNHVQAALKTILQHLKEHQPAGNIDRSDCGPALKKRRITYAQKVWSLKQKGLWDEDYGDHSFAFDDDDEDYDDSDNETSYLGRNDDDDAWIAQYSFRAASAARSFQQQSKNSDCDCGQPWRMSMAGHHVCRYFGTFHCHGCGNQWTSAFCWKGEKQSCRGCNTESLPVKTDRLQSGLGGGGVHDSVRCSMCQKLGYNCSR